MIDDGEDLIISHARKVEDVVDYPCGMNRTFRKVFPTTQQKNRFLSGMKGLKEGRPRLLYVAIDGSAMGASIETASADDTPAVDVGIEYVTAEMCKQVIKDNIITMPQAIRPFNGDRSVSSILKVLKDKKIEYKYVNENDHISYNIFIHALKESVFVVLLWPNIDSHALYEAWVCGAIPIIEFNSYMANKYKGLPILWTSDYSEITHSYLISKREEFAANEALYAEGYNLLRKSYNDKLRQDEYDEVDSDF